MKSKIIIFTNAASAYNISKRYSNDALESLNENGADFITYDINTNQFLHEYNNSSIVLFNDNKVAKINDFVTENSILIDEVIFLRHHNMNPPNLEDVDMFKGMHIADTGPYYHDVYRILFYDEINDKFKKILSLFNIEKINTEKLLLIKLQLLHEIYEGKKLEKVGKEDTEPTSDQDEEQKEWFKTLTESDKEEFKKLKEFVASTTYDNNIPVHRDALIALRDKILAEY